MKITSYSTALAVTLALVAISGRWAAANPDRNLVVVTNNADVCVKIDAIGVAAPPDGNFSRPNHDWAQVGRYEERDAAPGQTVRFEALDGVRAQVWASLRPSADCHSKTIGGSGPYVTQAPRVHLIFAHHRFTQVALL